MTMEFVYGEITGIVVTLVGMVIGYLVARRK